jgi:Ecdysteroid kinase-like family
MIELVTSLPLPVNVEQIDAAWLAKALDARFPGISVSRADVLTVIEGTSTKIRARIETDHPEVPETVIVKGGFEAHSPKLADMYRNEALFYAVVQPHLTMESPRCYFAGSDPDSHQSIVILEDMDAAHVMWLNPLVPLEFDAIADRLKVMAHYHARSWESPHFEAGGIWDWVTPRFGGWAMDYAERYLKPDVWKHYVLVWTALQSELILRHDGVGDQTRGGKYEHDSTHWNGHCEERFPAPWGRHGGSSNPAPTVTSARDDQVL